MSSECVGLNSEDRFGWDSPGHDFFLSCTHVGNFTQPELNPQGEALY